MAIGDMENAEDCLDEIIELEDEDISDRTKLNEIALSVVNNNYLYNSITQEDFDMLKEMIEDNPYIAFNAKAIFKHLTNTNYGREPLQGTGQGERKKAPETITEKQNLENLKVYPNPAKDKITIEIAENQINGKIEIYNILGAKLKQRYLTKDETRIDININDLHIGIYLVVLKSNNEIISKQKLIIN